MNIISYIYIIMGVLKVLKIYYETNYFCVSARLIDHNLNLYKNLHNCLHISPRHFHDPMTHDEKSLYYVLRKMNYLINK
jgi:hypothetical protein